MLLIRVNSLQIWRRLKLYGNSRVADEHRVLYRWLPGIVLLAIHARTEIRGCISRTWRSTERLLYLPFAFLFGLLLLSNLVISYTNLLRIRGSFSPHDAGVWEAIFHWKFIESTLLASWAFLFNCAAVGGVGLTRGAVAFLLTAAIILWGFSLCYRG
jgi:hypothetical protein